MIQIELFRDCEQKEVNYWLEKNQDKRIIDIKHCCGEYASRNSFMIIYEEPNKTKIANSPSYSGYELHCL